MAEQLRFDMPVADCLEGVLTKVFRLDIPDFPLPDDIIPEDIIPGSAAFPSGKIGRPTG